RLLQDLKWLYNEIPNIPYEEIEDMRYSYATTWTKQYLSMLYKNNKNVVMSELIFSRKGFYKNQNQSEAMERFLLKTDKTSWARLWETKYESNLADIYDSRAIYLCYKSKIEQAFEVFEKIPVVQTSYYNSATT